ncbi:MAG TPA: hemolysin family protein [Thermoanaerobaculia bacterium]|nr:hemolysin family protein [Thermoanaerobaculia bacterium]
MLIASLILAAVMILVNALYVAAEFGAVSARRSRLQNLAQNGDRLARIALEQIDPPERLDRYVAACQVGITLSSLGLGAAGQALLAPRLAPLVMERAAMTPEAALSAAAIAVLIVFTSSQMVLGELFPKSLALSNPTTMVRLCALPMRWSSLVLGPFVRVLNGSGNLVLRGLGFEPSGHTHVHSPEELELLLAESSSGGALDAEESRRLRRALQLRLRRARHLMTPRRRIVALDADLPFEELVRQVRDSPYTRLPVYRGDRDNVIGFLHARDVAARLLLEGPPPALEELLRDAVAVPESMTSDQLLQTMRSRRALQIMVLDEFGGIAGLISPSDVLREVLGVVPEDQGSAPTVPARLPDGRVRLPGRLPLDRAARWTGVAWEGEAETVGGLVSEVLGRLPQTGERLVIAGVRVEVEAVRDRAVVSVVATPVEVSGGG